MSSEDLVKVINILLGKLHLWEAGVGELSIHEFNLIMELGDWYEREGKLIAEGRRLTDMKVVLD